MTVFELIEKLKSVPPDLEVMLDHCNGDGSFGIISTEIDIEDNTFTLVSE